MPRKFNEQKYCSWCGSELVYKKEWAGECKKCGYVHYASPKPCSDIIIIKDNATLMVKRAIEPQLGKFDFPGGYMDMTDGSIEDCVYRELEEEVGLTKDMVSELSYFGSGISPYNWQNSEVLTAPFFFTCELKEGAVISVDQSENSQVRWVEKKDINQIDFAWEIDKEMIAKLWDLK